MNQYILKFRSKYFNCNTKVRSSFDENGLFHCEEGPACIQDDGRAFWIIHGNRHRIDGPAVISCKNAEVEWYINDVKYTEEKYWQKIYEMGLITKEQLFINLL